MWINKWICRAVIRNILFSILFYGILFVMDNRGYLFAYLPHKEEYRQMDAYIENSNLRRNYVRVTVTDHQGEVVAREVVKRGYKEARGSRIVVGYAPSNIQSVVRIIPLITSGQIAVLISLTLGNIFFIWKIYKANV